ncbi:MAG: hypothetical protein ACRD6W_10180, partial [Nitrososphaerales archaeon]
VGAMQWPEIETLWGQIQKDGTPDWAGGKALEYLVVRAFALSKLEVEYPYDVPPGGKTLEQIDGLVYLHCHTFLIECKDKETIDIEAIAKLRNQLLRRPETTLGCVFVSGKFSASALIITDFSVPHRILLWSGVDIDGCIKKCDFAAALLDKYRHLCRYGLTDHSPYYRELEV